MDIVHPKLFFFFTSLPTHSPPHPTPDAFFGKLWPKRNRRFPSLQILGEFFTSEKLGVQVHELLERENKCIFLEGIVQKRRRVSQTTDVTKRIIKKKKF